MRRAGRDVDAGALLGVEHLVAELEFARAVDHVADLERLGVHVQPRLEAGLADLVENLVGAGGVGGGDLAGRGVGARVDVALAGG